MRVQRSKQSAVRCDKGILVYTGHVQLTLLRGIETEVVLVIPLQQKAMRRLTGLRRVSVSVQVV